jgi:hypothetical protein
MDAQILNLDGLVNTMKTANLNMSRLIATLQELFPRVSGTFTMAAAATKVVTEPGVTASSVIVLSPTNAAAGTLMGSNESLYISTKVAGASFTVATAAGTAAAGTETFNYLIFNPL